MPYQYSQLDKENMEWFNNNLRPQTLCGIELLLGKMRGVYPFSINFEYPITALAGKNGSGKSTVLALACCAYHNGQLGYVPFDRSKSYYTFSDFFISTYDEEKPEGVQIRYTFLGDWRDPKTGVKFTKGVQFRKKRHGGKWNDYGRRLRRNVVFLGIQRIVPPSERKTECSYSRKFRSTAIDLQAKEKILEIAGRIMGKRYTSLDLRTVDKRRLFVVDRQTQHYSGFNMGAGENAIFTILIELFSAGSGTLLVIDEIELGLHEESQKTFIEELKKLCRELHCQIICSTHSGRVLDALPPEGRKFIETYQDRTIITPGISSSYATGKLAGRGTEELTVLVEDIVAESMIREFIPAEIRCRIQIVPVGSDQAVLRQLAAHFRERDYGCIAFLDGDKSKMASNARGAVKRNLEKRYNEWDEDEFDTWLDTHLCYLPGETCPEKWLIGSVTPAVCRELSSLWGIEEERTAEIFEQAQSYDAHTEFYVISNRLGLPEGHTRIDVIRKVAGAFPLEGERIERLIRGALQEAEK